MINLDLHNFQREAVAVIAPLIGKREKILLSMPSGTGKTITIVSALYEYYQHYGDINRDKSLFVVDRLLFKDQLIEIITNIFGIQPILVRDINGIGTEGTIFISTVQALTKSDAFTQIRKDTFATIIFLDCNRLGFENINTSVNRFVNHFQLATKIGVGYYLKPSLYFGEATFSYTINQAIKDKLFRPLIVKRFNVWENYKLNESLDINETLKLDGVSSEYFYTSDAIACVAQVILDNVNEYEKTIVICPTIKYANELSDLINEMISIICSQVIVANNSNDVNKNNIDLFNNSSLRMLIGGEYLFNEANLNVVDNIVVLKKFNSVNKFLQPISRFLRIYNNDSPVNILDFIGIADILEDFNSENVANEITNRIEINEITQNENPNIDENHLFTRSTLQFANRNKLKGVIGVDDISQELADIIINMPCEAGRMIGIFGKWGRGKTFLMNETWKVIQEKDENFERINFHAWKYQDTPAVWAYLYEKFAEIYYSSARGKYRQKESDKKRTCLILFFNRIRYAWNRLGRMFTLNTIRLGWGKILLFLLTFLFSSIWILAWSIQYKIYLVYKVLVIIGLPITVGVLMLYFRYRNPAIQLFKKYYSKPSFINVLGIQEEVQKELKYLIKAWNKKVRNLKLLLFVDDIDRCTEEKIIQLIDSLRVMLDDEKLSKNIVIISAVDEYILKRTIKRKYDDLECDKQSNENGKCEEFVKEYLDKIFLLGLRLGALTPKDVDEFFLEFTREDRANIEMPTFEFLISDRNAKYLVGDYVDDGYVTIDSDQIDNDELELENKNIVDNERSNHTTQDTLMSEKEFEAKDNISNRLSPEEINIFRKALLRHTTMTPRQIRIIYYRYLFAKNLLIRQYQKLMKKNIWVDSNYTFYVIDLLIQISISKDNNILLAERSKYINLKNIEDREYLKEVSISAFDYKMLLNVLEIVISY